MSRSVFHIIIPGEAHLQSRSHLVSLRFLSQVPVDLHPPPYHTDPAFSQVCPIPLEYCFGAKLGPEDS